MSIGLITLLMFGLVLILIALGTPISFVLGGVAALFIYFMWGANSIALVVNTTYAWMGNYYVQCIPMFILMALILERSGIVSDLYNMLHYWTANLRSGLLIGTLVICTLLAAIVGLGGMAVLTLGSIALPEMIKRGYDKEITMGCIMAGSVLGILIPPSIVFILYGIVAEVSIGKLFMGGIIPGIVTCLLFIAYVIIRGRLQPGLFPTTAARSEHVTWKEKIVSLKAVILPFLLIITVLGAIFSGAATATEASALGALGSLIVAAVYRRITWNNLKHACFGTLKMTCMVMWLLFGAAAFVSIYSGVGAQKFIESMILGLPLSKWGVLVVMQVILIFLGCFMDPGGIILIAVPIFVPIIKSLGFNPLWFGVLFCMNMQIGHLTPPLGFNLFFMRAVTGPEISMTQIYRSVIPFILLQSLGMIIVMIIPQFVEWLPKLIYR